MYILGFTDAQRNACKYALKKHIGFMESVPLLLRQDLEYSIIEHINENASNDSEENMKIKAEEFLRGTEKEYTRYVKNLRDYCFLGNSEETDRFIEELSYAKTNNEVFSLIDSHITNSSKKRESIRRNIKSLPELVRTILFFTKRNKTEINRDSLRRNMANHMSLKPNE